jgi:bifunctional DNA-binding transcriptional regulator/antitoxin component of YhaV-PrlF toxin-antitoxin module
MAWSQAANPLPAPVGQQPAAPTAPPPATPPAPQVALDAAVITITGMCDHPPADKSSNATCKTVITRAQFEKVLEAVQPAMPARARRSFADRYARALVMAHKAEEMGLDKSASYDERMKLQRIQVLSQELSKALQEEASQIPDKDIEDYYHANLSKFEQVDLERIYIPKAEQPLVFDEKDDKDDKNGKKDNAADQEKKKVMDEQAMKDEADKLQKRAAAGEDFAKLQLEAFTAAGIKSTTPNVEMGKTRRTTLPVSQVSVMDMKPGDVSAVIADQNGYFIFKLKSKDTMSLDQAHEEIKGTLRSQRLQDKTAAVQQSATPALNEAYFGPEAPARGPMPGMPMPPQPRPTPPGPK